MDLVVDIRVFPIFIVFGIDKQKESKEQGMLANQLNLCDQLVLYNIKLLPAWTAGCCVQGRTVTKYINRLRTLWLVSHSRWKPGVIEKHLAFLIEL